MKTNIVPLHIDTHANLKIIPRIDLSRFDKHNSTTIVFQEFALAAVELPIVFIKNEVADEYVCITLLGDKDPKNCYFKDGKPRGNYVPASFSHHPLGIGPLSPGKDEFTVLIDTESNLISETEGQPLFNEDGTQSEYLKRRVQAMVTYFNSMRAMKEFSDALAKLELLVPQGVRYGTKEEENVITGFYVVDEKKLNELPAEKFEELRKAGYMPLIYSHLISLNNIGKLASYIGKKTASAENPAA